MGKSHFFLPRFFEYSIQMEKGEEYEQDEDKGKGGYMKSPIYTYKLAVIPARIITFMVFHTRKALISWCDKSVQ